MVGVLKALQAEKARYHQELEDYRKEAAQTLRSQSQTKVLQIERPELPDKLEGILVDVVQKSQNRKLTLRKKRKKKSANDLSTVSTEVVKSSEAIWRDVSNVLDSSERHLPIAEKYFKRVFDLIQDPDSLLEGHSLWKEEDEREGIPGEGSGSAQYPGITTTTGGRVQTSLARVGQADPETTSTVASADEGTHGSAQDTFQPFIIDHTKQREEKALGERSRSLVERAIPGPSLPSVQSRNAEGSSRDASILRQNESSNWAGEADAGEVPSTAKEIRKKAQEFLVELELLQQLGSNTKQAKLQVPKTDQPQGESIAPEVKSEYVSVASSPIGVSVDSRKSRQEVTVRDDVEARKGVAEKQSISVQASLEDVKVKLNKEEVLPRNQEAEHPKQTTFFSDVLEGRRLGQLKASTKSHKEGNRFEEESSLSRKNDEVSPVDSHGIASKADRIFADSSVAPAVEIVERLLGGRYNYQEKYLECAVTAQKLDRIKAEISKPASKPMFEPAVPDDILLDGGMHEFETSRGFITSTIDDLFSNQSTAAAAHFDSSAGQRKGFEGTLISDFYDIPKHLQTSMESQNKFSLEPTRLPTKQETAESLLKAKYSHIQSRLVAPKSEGTEKKEDTAMRKPPPSAGKFKMKMDRRETPKRATSPPLTRLKSRERTRGITKTEPLDEEVSITHEQKPKDYIAGTLSRQYEDARDESQIKPKDYIAGTLSRQYEDARDESQIKPKDYIAGTLSRQYEKARDESQEETVASEERMLSPKQDLNEESNAEEIGPSAAISSTTVSYDKSKYQSRQSEVPMPFVSLDLRHDLEERVRKLEDKIIQSSDSKATTNKSVELNQEKAIDSEAQTESFFHMEQSVQTSPPALKAEEDRESIPEECVFEEVRDVAIEEVIPAEPDASLLPPDPSSLNFDGENEEVALLKDQYTVEKIQSEFKDEITLDNVVEEIVGRILSEELEREQQELSKQDLTSNEITSVLHGEISKMYKSAKEASLEAVEYTDEFNEMFLAHALLVSLTQKPEGAMDEEEEQIENLEFTEDANDSQISKPARPSTPVRSAWGPKQSDNEAFVASAARSIRSVTSAATNYFDTEEESNIKDASSTESSESSPSFYSAGSPESGGMRTPPTPATPRSYEDIMSSVESKLKVFDTTESSRAATQDPSSTAKVVRKLDLGGSNSGESAATPTEQKE